MTFNDFLFLAQAYDWDGHHDGGWWIVMGLGMVVFWILVILLVVWLVRTWSPGHETAARPAAEAESPLDVLDRRLAEGAVSIEEYEERRRVLTGRAGSRGSSGTAPNPRP